MHSTTQQAFELRGGEIGGVPGEAPERQVDAARAVIVDDNQRRAATLANRDRGWIRATTPR